MAKPKPKKQPRMMERVTCYRCGKRTYRASLRGDACTDCRGVEITAPDPVAPEPAPVEPEPDTAPVEPELVECHEVITDRWGISVTMVVMRPYTDAGKVAASGA